MSLPIKKSEYYKSYSYEVSYGYDKSNVVRLRPKAKKKKKNIVALFFAFLLLSLYCYFVCPYNFNNYLRPLFVNRFLNRNLNFDTKPLVSPTLNYIHNSQLFDKFIRVAPNTNTKEIAHVEIIKEMNSTKQKLLDLFKKYPQLEPAVFVW